MCHIVHSIADCLQPYLTQSLPLTLVVAYSGGRDSTVLLHAASQLRKSYPSLVLKAIHVNHGLQPDAESWVAHCENICASYDIPLTVISLSLILHKGESIENVARQQRYLAFARCLAEKAILLTAHHLEDQSETCLLQLLRGAGPLGLAGIAQSRSLGQGLLVRPLLKTRRTQIIEYAKQYQLNWIEDHSNQDMRFRRNFLRHQVIPLLDKLVPNVASCIARTSQHCAQTQQLLEEYLTLDLAPCLGKEPNMLRLSYLKKHPPLKQRLLFRHWLGHQKITSPSTKKIETLFEQMINAKADSMPCVKWGQMELRRYQDHLYLLPTQYPNYLSNATQRWHLSSPLTLWEGACWQATPVQGRGIKASKIKDLCLEVRFRTGGERCHPAGRMGSWPLKKVLQELGVPPWQRYTLPLFYQNAHLVAVGDLFICEGWEVNSPTETGWVLTEVR